MALFNQRVGERSSPTASLEALQEITAICNDIALSQPALEALFDLPNLASQFNQTNSAPSVAMLEFVTQQKYETLGMESFVISSEGIIDKFGEAITKMIGWLRDKFKTFISWIESKFSPAAEFRHVCTQLTIMLNKPILDFKKSILNDLLALSEKYVKVCDDFAPNKLNMRKMLKNIDNWASNLNRMHDISTEKRKAISELFALYKADYSKLTNETRLLTKIAPMLLRVAKHVYSDNFVRIEYNLLNINELIDIFDGFYTGYRKYLTKSSDSIPDVDYVKFITFITDVTSVESLTDEVIQRLKTAYEGVVKNPDERLKGMLDLLNELEVKVNKALASS